MSELLLIDDDEELCELLVSWLAQEGFVARACHDGVHAREALAAQQPAAVILDVMLPDGSGLELLKQLRSEYPDLPVLMLSGRGEPLDRILGLELGADDYLAKPCDPRELTARLRAVPGVVGASPVWQEGPNAFVEAFPAIDGAAPGIQAIIDRANAALAGTGATVTGLAAVERLYLQGLMSTRDANEGLAAFLARRAPAWEHQ